MDLLFFSNKTACPVLVPFTPKFTVLCNTEGMRPDPVEVLLHTLSCENLVRTHDKSSLFFSLSPPSHWIFFLNFMMMCIAKEQFQVKSGIATNRWCDLKVANLPFEYFISNIQCYKAMILQHYFFVVECGKCIFILKYHVLKIKKKILALTVMLAHFALTDIFRTLHQKTALWHFSLCTWNIFKTDNLQSDNTRLKTFKTFEIISVLFYEHSGNWNSSIGKQKMTKNIRILYFMILNNQYIREEKKN